MSMENSDYAALDVASLLEGLAAEELGARPAEKWQAASRDASGLMRGLGGTEQPVYRSISLAPSQVEPSPPGAIRPIRSCPVGFDEVAQIMLERQDKQKGPFKDFHQVVLGSAQERTAKRTVLGLQKELAAYTKAPIFALLKEAGDRVVDVVTDALSKADVDVSQFDEKKSSISAKIVVDATSFRFDVYILELQDADKAFTGAAYLMEVQRVSSSGCSAAWASVVDTFMQPLRQACISAGYFAQQTRISLVRQSSNVPSHFILDLGDDSDLEPLDEGILEAEYKNIVRNACNGRCRNWDTQSQLAELLARLSVEEESALRLIRVGAIAATIKALQMLILNGSRCDTTRAFFTVLSNLATRMSELEENVAYDLAAHCIMMVLKTGDLEDFAQLELLREAARALWAISSFLESNPLREEVKAAMQTCATSMTDARFQSHAQRAIQAL